MMMRMLREGGMPITADGVRTADDDNPRGYFELEAVKASERDTGWVAGAAGTVVKVVSPLLEHLPRGPRYSVIFMRRDLGEILASQRAMLERRGEKDERTDQAMREAFVDHIDAVERLLDERDDMRALYISYARTVADPGPTIERVRAFIDSPLDADAMRAAVDPTLHRQRSS